MDQPMKEEKEKEQQEKEQEEKEQEEPINTLFARINKLLLQDPIIQSFKLNYQFYLILIICIIMISYYSETNVIWAFITIILISAAGYASHYVSHRINALELFEKLDNDNYITKNKYVKTGMQMFCKMIDFHDQTHHDTSVNKSWDNIAIEFAMNFYVQAGAFIFIIYIARQLNLYVITLWGLMYATVHNINYDISPPATHMLHHVDKTTNYGIDIWDVVFNTKYGGDDSIDKLENINHYAINTAIITAVILLLMNLKISFKIGFE